MKRTVPPFPSSKITIARVDADGTSVGAPYSLDTKWDYASFVKDKASADTGGSW